MSSDNNQQRFSDFTIISSESKSWYVGKPGTNKNSFCVTWSPGAVLLYGSEGNVTLIFSEFNSYEKTKKWLSGCTKEQFVSVIAHKAPENIDYFHQALKHWGDSKHYR